MNNVKRALPLISVFVLATVLGFGFVSLINVGPGKAYQEIEAGDPFPVLLFSQSDNLPEPVDLRNEDGARAEIDRISVSDPFTAVITHPPIASLISVGVANAYDVRTISGAAGSVEPGAIVAVGNLDTSVVTFVNAEPEGSFEASIYAPPGTSIQVKHANPFISLAEIEATFGGTIAGDIIAGWMNATAGTIIQVPLAHGGMGGSTPFGFAGTIAHESGTGFWSMQGISGPEIPFGAGIQLPISATLHITTPALTPGMDLSGTLGVVEIRLRRFFDGAGKQIPMSQTPVSNFLTPTGLPISRGTPNWSPVEVIEALLSWQQAPDSTLTAILSTTITIPEEIPPGYYLPRVDLRFTGIPLGPPNNRTFRPAIFFDSPTTGYLPVLQIGDPTPPRLMGSLMTDTLYQGSRGTLAREDKDKIGLIPLTVFQPDKFIIPKDDPRTGVPIPYALEPFLPLISMTDRGTPNPPLLPFVLPGGELQVAVEKPDGAIVTLGPSPFLQSMNRTPAYPDGKVRDNDGGALQDIYQLITLNEEFQYTFDQYGHHLILMTGSVKDVWGNTYQVSNTFDVYVARPLKMESGQLPSTPYEIDDVFSPSVHIYPPLPADVEIHLNHFPNSVPPEITHTITGVANPFGYFHPPGPPIFMQPPGEFRVDISAVYDAPDGTLWMGHMTWGGIVEDPGSTLIAHGRRGLDTQDANPPLWFFHYLLGFNGIAHTNYPYYSGDIFWGIEVQTPTQAGADSIFPVITIEDTAGDVYTLLQQRWSAPHSPIAPWETLQDRLDLDEAPLVSTSPDGEDQLWNPEGIDQFGYAYRTSQRPGARVHETVSEEGLGIAYWRFNAPYGDQVGVEGDLPNDLKWEFGGAVFRAPTAVPPINEYAIYGSLWVLLPNGDPLGPRVTTPFRGTAGGPNGGPILTLNGEAVDIFLMPRGVQPGDILESGDIFSFSGHVGPPLNSQVAITVTSPRGTVTSFGGQASKVGWFYDPLENFPVDETGLWSVDVLVRHQDVLQSTGLSPTDFNVGKVLGSENVTGSTAGRYYFSVVEPGDPLLPVLSPPPGILTWPTIPGPQRQITLTAVPITVPIPIGLTDVEVNYTIRMPGFILDQGTLNPIGNSFPLLYDPLALHQEFPNLDLKAKGANRVGLTDPVWISFSLSGNQGGLPVNQVGVVFIDGEEVFVLSGEMPSYIFLPLMHK